MLTVFRKRMKGWGGERGKGSSFQLIFHINILIIEIVSVSFSFPKKREGYKQSTPTKHYHPHASSQTHTLSLPHLSRRLLSVHPLHREDKRQIFQKRKGDEDKTQNLQKMKKGMVQGHRKMIGKCDNVHSELLSFSQVPRFVVLLPFSFDKLDGLIGLRYPFCMFVTN